MASLENLSLICQSLDQVCNENTEPEPKCVKRLTFIRLKTVALKTT